MAGIVYLRTNRFEVKLEGITFKTKEFESLCTMNFLFPDGKIWARPPIVGLDVMRHPRDPSSLLMLLCFGVGCVILRLRTGEPLPSAIHNFLSDKRIYFVGFGIPEKKDLFPFEDLGLSKSKVDVGYLAAKVLKDPKFKKWELADLARKVLGIKRMVGLTDASSFERHEQMKCAICQLFITSVIAMGLLSTKKKKKVEDLSHKKSSFLKNLSSLHVLAEGWFKLPLGKKKKNKKTLEEKGAFHVGIGQMEDVFGDVNDKNKEGPFGSYLFDANIQDLEHDMSHANIEEDLSKDNLFRREFDKDGIKESPSGNYLFGAKIQDSEHDLAHAKIKEELWKNDLFHREFDKEGPFGNYPFGAKIQDFEHDLSHCQMKDDLTKNNLFFEEANKDFILRNDLGKETTKRPIRGILKCPSTSNLQRCNSSPSMPKTPPSTPKNQVAAGSQLKRANSKGCNVTFKCQ